MRRFSSSRRLFRSAALLATAVAFFVGDAGNARAYRTGADLPGTSDTSIVRWANPDVRFVVSSSGAPGLTFSAVEAAVVQAAVPWRTPRCDAPNLTYGGASASAGVSGDGINTIVWHGADWDSLGFPPGEPGATDVVYRRNGDDAWVIVEADIHLNAGAFVWSPNGGASESSLRSIRTVVGHEFGHLLGLAHPCEPDGYEGAPLCSGAPSATSPTMYPFYFGAEQESLEADDVAGLCFLYPPAPCDSGCGGDETCVAGTCMPACGASWCDVGTSMCIDGRCVELCGGLPCDRIECVVDDDCAATSTCASGFCVDARGRTGDPCDADAACATDVCASGVCSRNCADECPLGFVCESATQRCITDRAALGGACTSGASCASGVCLVDSGAANTCTRACGVGAPCPAGFSCETIDDALVCAPIVVPPASCSTQSSTRSLPTRWSPATVVVALILVLGLRRRKV